METTPSGIDSAAEVDIVGMGMSPRDLTRFHLALIERAECLAGGRRHLARFQDRPRETFEIQSDLPALADWIRRHAGRRIVVLASGDPLFYGIGAYLARALGPQALRFHPNVTSVAAAFARMGEPWQDAAVVSLHGRSREDQLVRSLETTDRIAVLTDPRHTPAWVGAFLQRRGFEDIRVGVFERLGTDEESVSWHAPAAVAGQTFAAPNLVVLKKERVSRGDRPPLYLGMPESAYAHEDGMMTKAEVRAVSLARLGLMPGQVLWDLGAGSGAVGIEASLLIPGGRIWAVEKNPARIAQIRTNRDRYGVDMLTVVAAELPGGLAELPDPDRVFIGGAGQALGATVDLACGRLPSGGVLVVNTVLMDSLHDTVRRLKANGMAVDVVQVQASRSRPLADSERMEALNPVWIVRGYKES